MQPVVNNKRLACSRRKIRLLTLISQLYFSDQMSLWPISRFVDQILPRIALFHVCCWCSLCVSSIMNVQEDVCRLKKFHWVCIMLLNECEKFMAVPKYVLFGESTRRVCGKSLQLNHSALFSAHLPLIQIRWQDTSRMWVTLEAHQTLLKIDLHTRSHVSRNFTAIYMQQQHINSALIISQNEALCMFVIQQQDGIKFNNGQRVCIINKNFASIRVVGVSLAV